MAASLTAPRAHHHAARRATLRFPPGGRWSAGGLTVVGGYVILTAVLIGVGLLITHGLTSSVGRSDDQVNAWFAERRTTGSGALWIAGRAGVPGPAGAAGLAARAGGGNR